MPTLEMILKKRKIPFLEFLFKREFLQRKQAAEVANILIGDDTIELEDLLLRYMGRDKLLLVKGLFYNDSYPCIDLIEVQDQLNDELVSLLTREQMLDYRLIMLKEENKKLAVAMDDPTDRMAIKFINKSTGLKVTDRYVTLYSDIKYAISQDRLIARYLHSEGIISEEDFAKISDLFGDKTADLESVFLRYVDRENLLRIKVLVNANKYEEIDLFEIKDALKDDFVELLTHEEMYRFGAIILYENNYQLAVAMNDPAENKVIRIIERITGGNITSRYFTLMSDIKEILRILEEQKQARIMEKVKQERIIKMEAKIAVGQVEKVVEPPRKLSLEPEIKPLEVKEDSDILPAYDIMELSKFSLKGDSTGGVRPIIEAIIKMALVRGASDIHIEPTKDKFLNIRYRIDGILTRDSKVDEIMEASREPDLYTKIVSVIKVLSGESGKNMRLDVNDKPQDGRIYIPSIDLDLRIIILPSFHGESVVIRVLRREMGEFSLDKLGFEPITYKQFKDVIEMPYGMLLVSGPTGSGKSTTQYAVLRLINSPGKKVLTIEDPVEYSIPGAVQNQTNPVAGFTFEAALRAFVRSDPDIIMVGEIRDVATASMAMESALTGHFVISSIHARDSIATVARLRDMGVDVRLVTATCNASLGQRLVRRVCHHCRSHYEFSTKLYEAMEQFKIPYDINKMYKGKGCPTCYYTGYQGRIGLFELLVMTRDIKELFLQKADDETIRQAAREQQGMHTLMEDALVKVSKGATTEEEVWRVTLLETDGKL